MLVYVMIPTYNEFANIKNLIEGILKLRISNLNIVVVDDNSPDGTWKIVKEISKKQKNVHLLLRTKDKGRGAAGKDGFIYCLKNKADVVVEMDADFSHNPKYIPKMLKELYNADIILGSRRIEGGKEVGRSAFRRFVTWVANLYIRIVLGLKVRDCNSGFRCFKRKVLEGIKAGKLESKGPAIVQEVLFKAHLKGFKIKEIPIIFIDRKKGQSKLGLKQLIAGYLMVLRLKYLSIAGKL